MAVSSASAAAARLPSAKALESKSAVRVGKRGVEGGERVVTGGEGVLMGMWPYLGLLVYHLLSAVQPPHLVRVRVGVRVRVRVR